MASYRVTWPFVYLAVREITGKVQVNGFYQGAIVDSDQVDEESLKRHLDRGAMEKFSADSASSPEEDDSAGKPGQNDSKAAWVDHAVSQGVVDQDEAEGMTKSELIELFK